MDLNIFTVYRADRISKTKQRGGGVLLALKTYIQSVSVDISHITNKSDDIDALCVRIISSSGNTISVLLIYISPDVKSEAFEDFFDDIAVQFSDPDRKAIVLGDFNAPGLVNRHKFTSNDFKSNIIRNWQENFKYMQINNIFNFKDRCLDLVFTNMRCTVMESIWSLVDLDKHHPALSIDIFSKETIKHAPIVNNNRKLNFNKLDKDKISNALNSTDWHQILSLCDPNINCDIFYNIINKIFSDTIPAYDNTKLGDVSPVWFSYRIKLDLRLKERHRIEYKKTNSGYHLSQYLHLRKKIKHDIKDARDSFISDSECKFDKQPSLFWSFIKKLRGKDNIPRVFEINNINESDPHIIADSFADHFGSVFLPASDRPDGINDYSCKDTLGSVKPPTVNDIIKIIQELPEKWSAGLDGIPCCVVKTLADSFAVPLAIIFSSCLKMGTFPDCWKTAKICPVHKSGSKSQVKNYRPISILCAFSKVFEIYLYSKLYCSFKNDLSPHQHGFTPRRSTVTSLLCFSKYTHAALSEAAQVDVFYTDLAKAFDKVDIWILISRLAELNLPDALLALLSSYLINRKNKVFYEGAYSKCYLSTSGVPQGSNLGPLLFIIFMNVLLNLLSNNDFGCIVNAFADDTKIFLRIDTVRDCSKLQRLVDYFVNLCADNNLILNKDKCEVMSISRSRSPIIFNYTINDIVVKRVSSHIDLGVVIDSEFNFYQHIDRITTASWKTLGFVTRSCKNLNSLKAMKAVYCALVRAKLEYASVVWNPIFDVHSYKIERIQNKFIKFLIWKLDGAYPELGSDYVALRKRLGLFTLKDRRLCATAMLLNRIVNGHVDCIDLLESIKFVASSSRPGRPFYLPSVRTNFAKTSPVYRLLSSGNTLYELDNTFDISQSRSARAILNIISNN